MLGTETQLTTAELRKRIVVSGRRKFGFRVNYEIAQDYNQKSLFHVTSNRMQLTVIELDGEMKVKVRPSLISAKYSLSTTTGGSRGGGNGAASSSSR